MTQWFARARFPSCFAATGSPCLPFAVCSARSPGPKQAGRAFFGWRRPRGARSRRDAGLRLAPETPTIAPEDVASREAKRTDLQSPTAEDGVRPSFDLRRHRLTDRRLETGASASPTVHGTFDSSSASHGSALSSERAFHARLDGGNGSARAATMTSRTEASDRTPNTTAPGPAKVSSTIRPISSDAAAAGSSFNRSSRRV